jgi:hypothetical protein
VEVVGIVRRRDFYRSRAEGRIDEGIRYDRNLALRQRNAHLTADQICVARILRMNGDRRVSEQRLRSRRRHRQAGAPIHRGIADGVERPVHRFVLRLQI